jgi:hypothetical protein
LHWEKLGKEGLRCAGARPVTMATPFHLFSSLLLFFLKIFDGFELGLIGVVPNANINKKQELKRQEKYSAALVVPIKKYEPNEKII